MSACLIIRTRLLRLRIDIGNPCDNPEMPNKWIENAVTGIRGRHERMELEQRTFLHHSELVRAEGPRFWAALIAVMEENVAEFNAHFADDSSRTVDISKDPISLRIALRTRKFPQVQVTLALNLIASAIDIETVKTLDVFARAQTQPSGRVTFLIRPDNSLEPVIDGSSGNSIEQIAERILTPIFQEVS